MAVHTKDRATENPRMQCACCHHWMRLHGRRLEMIDGVPKVVTFQRFYGSCNHTGGDHLAGNIGADGARDVCAVCCDTECKRIAGS